MTAPTLTTGTEHLPSTRNKASERQVAAVTLVRDLWKGAEQVRDRATVYLPQAPGEDNVGYRSRLARSVYTNFFRKAIEGLCGLVFRKDPVLGQDVPARIREHWEDLDNSGTHGDVFLRDLMQDAMIPGHAAFLVDFPNTGGRVMRIDEEQLVQPYWVPLTKEQLLSWRTTVENGQVIVTQLVIEECGVVPHGRFGERQETRYRVFTRERIVVDGVEQVIVSVRVLMVTDRKEVVEVAGSYAPYPTQTEIPVVEVPTSGKRSLFESDPPLLDLAYLNIAHYQVRSDYHWSIHKTCVPIWVETGVEPPGSGEQQVVLGPSNGRSFSNPDATAQYVSHDGASLASVKGALDDLKDEIGTLGVAMLAPQKRVAETVEAKRLDKSVGDSALAVTARALQDAAERGLQFHANYLGEKSGGSISINRDFEQAVMEPAVMVAYVQAAKDVGFPLHELLVAFQKGGRIGDDVDLDALEGKMAFEMEARRAAEQREAEERTADLQAQGAAGLQEAA